MSLSYESESMSQMREQGHGGSAAPASGLKRTGSFLRRPRVRLGAVVAVLAAAGFVAWAVVSSTGGSSPTTPAITTASGRIGPIKVSENGLAALSKALRQPIYWMGPKPGYTYELTRTGKRNVYVRYLPPGVKVGDPRASFTIIATYPFPNSYRALKRVAKGRELEILGGGIAVVHQGYPRSVHVAFPKVAYQVEVYDPSPARSLQIAVSGNIRPVR
jgi:hypothetical protein